MKSPLADKFTLLPESVWSKLGISDFRHITRKGRIQQNFLPGISLDSETRSIYSTTMKANQQISRWLSVCS